RTSPGNPDVCPVGDLHKIFSDRATIGKVDEGCRSAGIGCIECKSWAADALVSILNPMQERRKKYEDNPRLAWDILEAGSSRARKVASATMDEVREAMGMSLDYEAPGNAQSARITAQYLAYVETLRELDVNVAAEFIYMAAVLIHIKSKMLLPRDPDAPAAEDDPRSELVNRLLEHEKFKSAAQMLLQKQQIEDAVRHNPAIKEFMDAEGTDPEIAADVIDLVKTFQQILER